MSDTACITTKRKTSQPIPIPIPVSRSVAERNNCRMGPVKKYINIDTIKRKTRNIARRQSTHESDILASCDIRGLSRVNISHPLEFVAEELDEVIVEDELDYESMNDYSFDGSASYAESMDSNFTASTSVFSLPRQNLLPSLSLKSYSDLGLSPVNAPGTKSKSPNLKASNLARILDRNESRKRQDTERKLAVLHLKGKVLDLRHSLIGTSKFLIDFYKSAPRFTDDTIPDVKHYKDYREYNEPQTLQDNMQVEELKTFNCCGVLRECELDKLPLGVYKAREVREGSSFLMLFAHDYNARLNGTLPNSYSSEEIAHMTKSDARIADFHKKYNIVRVSNLSRDKLWKYVALSPREDNCPSSTIDHSNYIHIGGANEKGTSLVRCKGAHLPWANSSSPVRCSPPAGIRKGCRPCFNGSSPSSGVTHTQFTVKGWANSRWLDSGST